MKLTPEQIPNIMALKGVDIQEIYDRSANYCTLLVSAMTEVEDQGIQFNTLDTETRASLGFRTWSKSSEENGLIPLYLVDLIPGSTLVVCPLFEGEIPNKIGQVDKDVRAGCIAYEFYRG